MVPAFLFPEGIAREDGHGAETSLDNLRGQPLLLTLGVTRILEQASLDVSIWGSADGKEWSAKPILGFPQKFYCGTYQILLDLTRHPDVKFLRVKWSAQRWGKGETKPLFGFYIFAQEMKQQVLAIGA